MPKIKITNKQYNSILMREQESRLNAFKGTISENVSPNSELLKEGWKEVVLGVALMLGVRLTGQNKLIATNVVKDSKVMSDIKHTLEDEEKTKELIDAFEEKGMKEPEKKLALNAERVVDNYNKFAKENGIDSVIDVKTTQGLVNLNNKSKLDYELTPADSSGMEKPAGVEKVIIQDVLDIQIQDKALFVRGGFTLTRVGADMLKLYMDALKNDNIKILSVEIEVSTDAEQTEKFIDANDSTGNIQLLNLRIKSIADIIASAESSVSIRHREIPNNGSHDVNTQQFEQAKSDPKLLDSLRQQTSKYRYVKLKVVGVFNGDNLTSPNISEIIKVYRTNFNKIIKTTGKVNGIEGKVIYPYKKYSCKVSTKEDGKKHTCQTHA